MSEQCLAALQEFRVKTFRKLKQIEKKGNINKRQIGRNSLLQLHFKHSIHCILQCVYAETVSV